MILIKDFNFQNFMDFPILVEDKYKLNKFLLTKGIEMRSIYYANCSKLFKMNNKSPNAEKYEKEILCLPNHKKIKMISHSTSMTEVFNDFDLIITVTGTVAIESILANKPVVTLIKTLNNTVKNCIYLEKLDNLEDIILNVKNDSFPKATLDEKIGLINLLNRTSYEGNVSDVFNDPNCLDEDNINLIVSAFNEIIEK